MPDEIIPIVSSVRKKQEFEAFLGIIESAQVDTWEMVARALDVRPATITEWKELPEARTAISNGIANALKEMQKVGSRDWKMWKEKLNMLGVKTETGNQPVNMYNNYQNNVVGEEVTDDKLVGRIVGIIEKIKSSSEAGSATGGGGSGDTVVVEGHIES